MVDINRYMGKWYEIARIPTTLEYEMVSVTAEYALQEDGTISVVNSGYIGDRFRQVKATAKPTDIDGVLSISFFENLTSDYKILAIDKDYQYSLVGGKNKYHLWVLGRTERIPVEIYNSFLQVAQKNGYSVDRLRLSN